MVLLPLGWAKNTLWTGFSNNYLCFSIEGWHTSALVHHFCYIAVVTLLWYWVATSSWAVASNSMATQVTLRKPAGLTEVLWLRAPFQASNQIILWPCWYFLIPLPFPHASNLIQNSWAFAAGENSSMFGFTVVGIFNVVNLEEYSGYRGKNGFAFIVKFLSFPAFLGPWTYTSVVPFFVIPLLGFFSPVSFILWVKFEQYAES